MCAEPPVRNIPWTLNRNPARTRHKTWKTLAAEALAGTGVHASRPVHANLTAPALVAEALAPQ